MMFEKDIVINAETPQWVSQWMEGFLQRRAEAHVERGERLPPDVITTEAPSRCVEVMDLVKQAALFYKLDDIGRQRMQIVSEYLQCDFEYEQLFARLEKEIAKKGRGADIHLGADVMGPIAFDFVIMFVHDQLAKMGVHESVPLDELLIDLYLYPTQYDPSAADDFLAGIKQKETKLRRY